MGPLNPSPTRPRRPYPVRSLCLRHANTHPTSTAASNPSRESTWARAPTCTASSPCPLRWQWRSAPASADISKTLNTGVKDKALWQCLSACSSGFENAIKKLDVSMAGMDRKAMADTMGWMMTVVADTEKCCGGCKHFEGEVKEQLMGMMGKFGKQCSITLDLAKAFP